MSYRSPSGILRYHGVRLVPLLLVPQHGDALELRRYPLADKFVVDSGRREDEYFCVLDLDKIESLELSSRFES